MDAGCQRARAGAFIWRETERLNRDPDRPARVLADVDALQGETGLAQCGVFRAISGRASSRSRICIQVIGLLSPPNAPAKLQRNQIRVCCEAANNSIAPLTASAFVRQALRDFEIADHISVVPTRALVATSTIRGTRRWPIPEALRRVQVQSPGTWVEHRGS